MDQLTFNISSSQDHANIAKTNVGSNIYNKNVPSGIKSAVKELAQAVDRFEHTKEVAAVGYEKFAAYREVTSQLDKLRTIDVPQAGVPNAMLIKSTLESLQNEIQAGNETLSADPYILINLLNNILEKID